VKALLPDALIVLGAVLVPFGVSVILSTGTAIVVAGLECILLGLLTSRVSGGRR
jgi:hypothetical protein